MRIWTPIIPNSNLIVSTVNNTASASWLLTLVINPTDAFLLLIFVVILILIIVGAGAVALQIKEK